jgi:hypothetical protein
MLNTTLVRKRRKKMLNTLYCGASCMLSRPAFQFYNDSTFDENSAPIVLV